MFVRYVLRTKDLGAGAPPHWLDHLEVDDLRNTARWPRAMTHVEPPSVSSSRVIATNRVEATPNP
jgi:hypothetical protein